MPLPTQSELAQITGRLEGLGLGAYQVRDRHNRVCVCIPIEEWNRTLRQLNALAVPDGVGS